MKTLTHIIAVCAFVISASGLQAQAPIPGGAAGGAAPAGAAGAAPAGAAGGAAQPKTLWSFLGLSKDNLAACKAKFCASGLGQMAKSMFSPMRIATGGIMPVCCPDVLSAADLAKMTPENTSPAEAAAAKIKAEEAAAKARRAAVRYLGTVDCHYFPEAEGALVAALRDTNECVRMEAAFSLGNGCCCTKRTMEKLNLVVSGSDADGSPSETSERVKMAALAALQKCLAHHDGLFVAPENPREAPPPRELPPEGAATPNKSGIQPARAGLPPADRRKVEEAVAQARIVFAAHAGATPPAYVLRPHHNLLEILISSASPREVPEVPACAAAKGSSSQQARVNAVQRTSYSATPGAQAGTSFSSIELAPIGRIPQQQ